MSRDIKYERILCCPLCDFSDDRLKRVSRLKLHMLQEHNLDSQQAFNKLFNIEHPQCKCGCQELVNWGGWCYGYSTFVHNHGFYKIYDPNRKLKREQDKQRGTPLSRRIVSFIERSLQLFGNERFSYVRVKDTFKTTSKPVTIHCLTCNSDFETTPYIHVHTKSGGCRSCFINNVSVDMEEYVARIKRIHGDNIIWLNPRKICDVHQKEDFQCTRCNRTFAKSFNNLIHKQYGCPYHNGPSKGQLELHEALSKFDKFLLPPEQPIYVNGTYFRVDCLFPNEKFIVEYQGDWWHGNPKMYKPDDLIGADYKTLAKDKWRADAERKATLESAGYHVFMVWQSEWKSESVKILESIRMELERF